MIDDYELLRRYVEHGSDAAFGEVVARYVNLVYSVALRECRGNSHLAQDVAQMVFTDLARKARWLPPGIVLAGWLHRAACYAARQMLRTERRRLAREQELFSMQDNSGSEAAWQEIGPLLDAALNRLSRTDRDALVLRYFSQRSLAEVGVALGSSEEAARKRVSRALDKLRQLLDRRGISVSGASLSAVLTAHAVHAAPAGLATVLTSGSAAATSAGAFTLTALNLIAMTKFKTATLSVIVIAGLATPLVTQHQSLARVRRENAALRFQLTQSQSAAPLPAAAIASNASSSADGERYRELLRLRGEVSQLRRQTNDVEKLRREIRHLRAATVNHQRSSADNQASTDFPREAWAFAGYADPTAAFQSLVWSASRGEVPIAMAAFSPEQAADRQKTWAGFSEAQVKTNLMRDMQHTKRFRVLGQETVSPDEVLLRIHVEGERTPDANIEQTARMKNINGEWKFDGWATAPQQTVAVPQ